MKKGKWIIAVATAVALSGATAFAALLSNGSGQSCGDLEGTWHFVNNQTGGAPAGTLTATFTTEVTSTGPSKVLGSNQHFIVIASGMLIDATTDDLPGKLVLSDFSCSGGKEEPPKK